MSIMCNSMGENLHNNIFLELCTSTRKNIVSNDLNTIIFLNLLNHTNEIFNLSFNLNKIDNLKEFESEVIILVNTIINNYNVFNNYNLNYINNNVFNLIKDNNKLKDNINVNNVNNVNNLINYVYMNNMNKDNFKYSNNNKLSEYVANLASPKYNNNQVEKIFDCNVKVNSFMCSIIKKLNSNHNIDWSKNKNNLYCNTFNENSIYNLEFLLNTKEKINIINNNILINDIKSNNDEENLLFDLIIFDLPSDIHNIIHANCCEKIKQLKIRGTKSESLLLQFVMCSLNKSGRAIIIVPDSFLFNQSIQPLNTKKYLLDNFNVKKIIQLDDELLYGKCVKNSLIYFENSSKTDNIVFNKLLLKNDIIVEENIINVSYDKIKNNNFQLYYKIYLDKNECNTSLKYIDITDLYNFVECSIERLPNDINNIIIFDKYYKDTSSIKLINLQNNKDLQNNEDYKFNENQSFYIYEKCNEDNRFLYGFMNKYIKHVICNKINLYIKGKMNQLCIDLIKTIKLPLINIATQKTIINYYNYSNKLYNSNLKDIEEYEMLKNNMFEILNVEEYEELSNIIKLYKYDDIISDENILNDNLLGIVKNAKNTGLCYMVTNKNDISTNSHYIKVINSNYINKFVYYYLCYNKEKINNIANINQQSNLTKSALLSLKIPSLNIFLQESIINYCDDYSNSINKLMQDNENIKNKDIMDLIIKLNNL